MQDPIRIRTCNKFVIGIHRSMMRLFWERIMRNYRLLNLFRLLAILNQLLIYSNWEAENRIVGQRLRILFICCIGIRWNLGLLIRVVWFLRLILDMLWIIALERNLIAYLIFSVVWFLKSMKTTLPCKIITIELLSLGMEK